MLWSLAFLAVAVDLGGAFIALNPRVTADYAAFFIARSSDCLLRPIDGVLPKDGVARLVSGSPDAGHVIACGMAAPETPGTWTVGREAALLVRLKATAGLSLVLQISDAFRPEPTSRQRVILSAGGISLGEAVVDGPGPHSFTFPLDGARPDAGGRLLINMKLPDAKRPRDWLRGNSDSRDLGIMLASIELRPSR
jgi:hypothetical protein